jgi:hypothetical protein
LYVIRSVLRKSKTLISDKYGEAQRVHAEVFNKGGFQVCTTFISTKFCRFGFVIVPVPIQLLKVIFDRYDYRVSKNIWLHFPAMVNGLTPLLGLIITEERF